MLMTRHYPDLDSVSDWLKQIFSQSEHYPDLCSDVLSVWNFCARFSDVINSPPLGNQWWRRKMSTVLSGYAVECLLKFYF